MGVTCIWKLSADIGAATTVPGMPGGNGSSDTSDFQECQAGYTGSWVQVRGEFGLYLPSDWESVDLDEEDQANDIYFAAITSSDQNAILVAMSMNLTDWLRPGGNRRGACREGNYSSLFEVAQDAMAQQGYTVEKTETMQ